MTLSISNTQYKTLCHYSECHILRIVVPSVIVLSDNDEYRYADCHDCLCCYAERHNAECHCAEYSNADSFVMLSIIMVSFIILYVVKLRVS